MKKTLILLCFSLVCICCRNTHKESNAVASIQGKQIFIEEVDSLIAVELYRFRKQVLDGIIFEKIIEIEFGEREMGVEAFKQASNNSVCVSETEILDFINSNPAYLGKEDIVVSIISGFKSKESLLFIVDSLKNKHGVKIFLPPPSTRFIDTQKLFKIPLNNTNPSVEVVLVVSFDCPMCGEKTSQIRELAKKYSTDVGFNMVYLNQNYGIEGNAVVAANNQGAGWEMAEAIMEHGGGDFDKHVLDGYAKRFGLDLLKFANDINDGILITDMLLTRDYLFSCNVYQVPGIIIEGLLYDEEITMDQLEGLLKTHLSKK